MKNKIKLWLAGIALVTCITTASAFGQAVDQTEATKALIAKHDLNGNGKIDASEHKEYARERARLVKAKALEAAKNRPAAKPGERVVIPPARWTSELFKKYDANKNGRLDSEEREKEYQDRRQAALEAAAKAKSGK